MSLPTDRDLAEEAKQRANEKSTSEFDIVNILCPACNEPVTHCEPNPNEFVPEEDSEPYKNDQHAYEFSPANIIEHANSDTAWDKVHVVPERVEYDDGERLRVAAYKHDHSTEGYQAWKRELDELKDLRRRAAENQGLDAFGGGD